MTVDGLTAFGFAAVVAMLITYALEDLSSWFILAFAAACALGSIYGFLQGAWPFGLAEAIWSIVAVRRWIIRRTRPIYPYSVQVTMTQPVFACDMSAIPPAARAEHHNLIRHVVSDLATDVVEISDGFELNFQQSAFDDVARFVAAERLCCPFLRFTLDVAPIEVL